MWEIYDALITGISGDETLARTMSDGRWSLAETNAGSCGLAMTTPWNQIAPMYPGGLAGLPVKTAAAAVKSWNLDEAGFGMAAINAHYNRAERMDAPGWAEPYDNYCTEGLDLKGKTVGLVGHLRMPPQVLEGAKRVYILEKHPQPGDYPDSACEFLLPACDFVLITGSALVNKTLPRLLELSKQAYTILTGPTVPMCPALLDFGIDRLAGMAVCDAPGLRKFLERGSDGPPYPFGKTFLIQR